MIHVVLPCCLYQAATPRLEQRPWSPARAKSFEEPTSRERTSEAPPLGSRRCLRKPCPPRASHLQGALIGLSEKEIKIWRGRGWKSGCLQAQAWHRVTPNPRWRTGSCSKAKGPLQILSLAGEGKRRGGWGRNSLCHAASMGTVHGMCIVRAVLPSIRPGGSPSAPLVGGISAGNLNVMFVSFYCYRIGTEPRLLLIGLFFGFVDSSVSLPGCLVILPGVRHLLLHGHHTPIPGGLPTLALANGYARWPLRVKALEHIEHKSSPSISNPSASNRRHHHLRNSALSTPSHSSQERDKSLRAQPGSLCAVGLCQQL